jgi:hypothetical protein
VMSQVDIAGVSLQRPDTTAASATGNCIGPTY